MQNVPEPKAEKFTPLQKKLSEINRSAEEREAKRRADKTGYPYVDPRKVPITMDAVKMVSEEVAREAKIAPLEFKGNELALAAFDPNTAAVKKTVSDLEAKKYAVKIFVASLSGLAQAWNFYRFVSEVAKDITGKFETAKLQELIARFTTFQAVQDEVKNTDFRKLNTTELFGTILAGALATRASDIHLEAEEKRTKIRFRIDGLLHDLFDELPQRNYDAIISRIKLLSSLKINVRGEPQDGRFTIKLPKKEIEMRVSIIPSEFGETVVMRVLDPDAINVDLGTIGLRPDDLALVDAELSKPHGLILNTGPTGSGKTTTLYAFLRRIVNPEIKIITVEDPIEYRIEGVEQTQVNPEVGYTFAKGLRAIVRQDPDVILVGEIRDLETADIALQASLTGHMVLSTLHTNDAIGAVPRLVDLGSRPTTIGPALSLVIAQRLVRKLCENCRKRAETSAKLRESIKKFLDRLPKRVDRKPYQDPTIFEPVGCSSCNNFGYKGRRGIFEFFKGGSDLEQLVLTVASEVALRELAKKQEMVMMQEDGVLKVLTGITTFKEVEEVTGPIEW